MYFINSYMRENESLQKKLNQHKQQQRRAIQNLDAAFKKAEKEKRELEIELQKQTQERNQRLEYFQRELSSSKTETMQCQKQIVCLDQDKKDLTLRLSKLDGANLKYNNPNIDDLSDENRQTKLAKEFSELFDNEWVDAFETIVVGDEKEKTQFMLDILGRANKLCLETSQTHMKAIKHGFATLVVRNEAAEKVMTDHLETVTGVKIQKPYAEYQLGKGHNLGAGSAARGNGDADDRTKSFDLTLSQEIDTKNQVKVTDEMQTESATKTAAKGIQTNVLKETKGVQNPRYKDLTVDFEKIPNEQKKYVLDIRKFVENELSAKYEETCTDIIMNGLAEKVHTDESLRKYVQRCLKLCWSMCRHEPPVHIRFHNINGDFIYDTNIFKPYTKTGKFLDFVVWPVFYLHEGGPMLCKGVAQGRK